MSLFKSNAYIRKTNDESVILRLCGSKSFKTAKSIIRDQHQSFISDSNFMNNIRIIKSEI